MLEKSFSGKIICLLSISMLAFIMYLKPVAMVGHFRGMNMVVIDKFKVHHDIIKFKFMDKVFFMPKDNIIYIEEI